MKDDTHHIKNKAGGQDVAEEKEGEENAKKYA